MSQLRTLLTELHRRSLWQLLGSYAVGSWLVLQLAETLSSLLGLPLWFGTGVILLLAAGLPLVVLTSVLQSRSRPALTDAPEGADPAPNGALSFFTWRKVLMIGAGVALLFSVTTGGYLGLRQLGVGPIGTLQAKGVIAFAERVVLAEFDNRSPDPTIGETVTALFRVDLAQSDAITLLERTQIVPVLQRMRRAPDTPITMDVATEVAQREGIKAIVTGEVLALGTGFVISARLVSVADGSSLVADRATASDVEDVPDAVDQLSARLRERIGESLRTIQGDPPLMQVTTPSLAALRLYARAQRANEAGEYQTAAALLEQALSDDPEFAMAHRMLGIILSNASSEPDRAVQAFKQAFENRDRLTERERFLAEATYHTYVAEDLQTAVETYQALLDRYPTDGVALNNLGVRLQGLGRLEEAAEVYQRAIQTRPGTRALYGNAINLFSVLGMQERMESAFNEFQEQFPDNPSVLRTGASLASSNFDYDRAEEYATRLLESRRGDPVWESVALFELGSLALVRGQVEAGVASLVRGVEITEGRLPFMTMAPSLFRAQMEAQAELFFRQDRAEARRILDRALSSAVFDTTSGDRGLLVFAQLVAQVGQPERARSLVAAFDSAVGSAGLSGLDEANRALALGHIASAEGRYEDALDHFRPEPPGWFDCPLCGVQELASTFELAGRPDSALAVYERYAEAEVLYRVAVDGPRLWQVLLDLGRLYEERGRVSDAEQMYARFLALWAEADQDQQPKVAEARRALERLRAPPASR